MSAITPRSSATKTATNRAQETLRSMGRIHTIAAAPAQKASAMTVALRTVELMAGLTDTPAKTWTRDPVAMKAQIHNAATRPRGTRAMIRS